MVFASINIIVIYSYFFRQKPLIFHYHIITSAYFVQFPAPNSWKQMKYVYLITCSCAALRRWNTYIRLALIGHVPSFLGAMGIIILYFLLNRLNRRYDKGKWTRKRLKNCLHCMEIGDSNNHCMGQILSLYIMQANFISFSRPLSVIVSALNFLFNLFRRKWKRLNRSPTKKL